MATERIELEHAPHARDASASFVGRTATHGLGVALVTELGALDRDVRMASRSCVGCVTDTARNVDDKLAEFVLRLRSRHVSDYFRRPKCMTGSGS